MKTIFICMQFQASVLWWFFIHSWLASLRVINLSFRYGKESALKDVSLEIHSGTLTALVGPNGAGKSTLLRLLQGQSVPEHGQILLDESPVRANRNQIALMPQRSSINWNFPITVEALVALGQVNTSNTSCCEIEASLQRVGLSALAKKTLRCFIWWAAAKSFTCKNPYPKCKYFPFG